MISQSKQKVVLLGMMGRMRVAGAVWQALHYLVGFERLGYDTYYVEAHGCTPWAFRENEPDAAAFINSVMCRFDMSKKWAFHAMLGSGSYYGMSEGEVKQLYSSAAVIFNLHGGTVPTPEQAATGRLVYIDTDPVNVQVEIHREFPFTIQFLEQHCAFFTFAENYGKPDCPLPVSKRFPFRPTRQPVVLDFWDTGGTCPGDMFTTIGNWQQLRRVVEFEGEEYHWSKHLEFLKILDLPGRTTQNFELSLSSCDDSARALLAQNGWKVRDAFSFSHDLDAYRGYVQRSRGEFTVAKDQNIRLRTGWFSDRSATYLAAGRPVVTQDTGFGNVLPTGAGLFAFSDIEQALAGVDAINTDYHRHGVAAAEIARDCFSHEVVLGSLLAELGLQKKPRHRTSRLANIIGYFGSNTGMGAAARSYARALESAGTRPRFVDVSSLAGPALAPSDPEINVICCNVASHYALLSHLGEEFFRDRYNIGVWLWETAPFPTRWHDRFIYYDEIWAPTSFIASLLSPVSPIRVVRIPQILKPDVTGSRERGRQELGLACGEFVYAFVFDFHSRAERKNPLAVIEAFRAAFSPSEAARLVIKCSHPDFNRGCIAQMQARAKNHRVSIYAGDWNAQQVADLIAACDCYVSLHRAEGVGLPIAEAMSAGKPVIATAWSGNMDFMNVANSYPVRYELVELDHNVAHYQAGASWAEPSLEHAAEMLRHVFENRQEAQALGARAQRDIETTYSSESIARLVARRLDLISKRDRFRTIREKLASPVENLASLANEFSDMGEYFPVEYLRYQQLERKLQRIVRDHVPPEATLVIVSKGDEDLLRIHDGPAWHFPQDGSGAYAGHYPADSAEAIRHLDALRAQGGDFILFPQTAFWWLEHYVEFRDHLHHQYHLAYSDEYCRVFELSCGMANPLEAA